MSASLSAPSAPLIAIVGRPNVGKSTLFNRLLGARKAVVSVVRGTTRDRLDGQLIWRNTRLRLADTGGMELQRLNSAPREHPPGLQGLAQRVQQRLRKTIDEADGVLLVCDGQQGLVPADELILEMLRKTGKPVVLAANKLDHQPVVPPEFLALGVDGPVAVSALHGKGIGELLDRLVARCVPAGSGPAANSGSAGRASAAPAFAVAIVGRQNVGKSSLVNALVREERVLVSEVPGTTRDAIDTTMLLNGAPVTLIDTAGLRHKRKVKSPLDLFSMARTGEMIARCHVALVVLDATQGVTRDDQRIITQVAEAGCGVVILVNKWDLAKRGRVEEVARTIHRLLPAVAHAPVVAVSAKTGFQVKRSLTVASRVHLAMQRGGLSDDECLALLKRAWAAHPPTRFQGRAIQLKGARVWRGRPMTIDVLTAPVGWLSPSYQHYLLKQLHTQPRLSGVPLRLVVKGPVARR